MSRMRWTLDQKKHHVAAWRASGLTREQYCELYDIPFKSLRQWPQDVAKAEKRVRAPDIIPVSVSGTPGIYRNRPDRELSLLTPWAETDETGTVQYRMENVSVNGVVSVPGNLSRKFI